MSSIHHALVLNLHQPPGNLDALWETQPWEAKEVLFALDRFGTGAEVRLRTGAWNTEDHYGDDFTQWTGSEEQKAAHQRVRQVSDRFHACAARSAGSGGATSASLQEAQWRLLRAETSCNFYWGTAWLGRAHADLDACEAVLDSMEPHSESRGTPAGH